MKSIKILTKKIATLTLLTTFISTGTAASELPVLTVLKTPIMADISVSTAVNMTVEEDNGLSTAENLNQLVQIMQNDLHNELVITMANNDSLAIDFNANQLKTIKDDKLVTRVGE